MNKPNRTAFGLKPCLKYILLLYLALAALAACSPNYPPKNSSDTAAPDPTASSVITLHYNERPPYLVTTDQGVGGLTGDPTTIVFKKSGIPFRWEQTPSKRQIYLLQQNSGRDCLVGWFKNQDREKFAKYTLPIYQDQPQVALMRADNDLAPNGSRVADLLSNQRLTLLVKDGYSYGDFLDGKIKESHPVQTVTTVENSGMLKMVFNRHADYFLIAPEEADGLIKSSEFDLHDFKFIHFSDMPYGEKRYILCSRQVEDAVIEQLNSAIQKYVTLPTP